MKLGCSFLNVDFQLVSLLLNLLPVGAIEAFVEVPMVVNAVKIF